MRNDKLVFLKSVLPQQTLFVGHHGNVFSQLQNISTEATCFSVDGGLHVNLVFFSLDRDLMMGTELHDELVLFISGLLHPSHS